MFTFKLQTVLNYRQSLEETTLLEFAAGQKRLQQEQRTLSEIREKKALLLTQWKALLDKTFPAADISLYHAYHEFFKGKEILQIEVVHQAGEAVNRLREALLAAVRDRKIMDNLSEKQRQAYEKNMAAIERGIADETAVMRFIRKKK
jgi:flagellar FliJ protein